MMDKNAAEHLLCIYCDKEALPDTDPPVCADHIKLDKKASEPATIKELEAKPVQCGPS